MIGVSVACALALMVGAFSVIFAFLDPFVADFVQDGTGNNPPPTRQVAQLAASTPPGSDNTGSTDATDATEPVAPTAAAPPPTASPAAAPTATPVAFRADYRVTSSSRINFREGPGVRFPVVTTLAPGTDVQYLNESQATQNPGADLLAPDGEWLKFRLADGQEGWIRDVDVTQLNP